MVNADWIAVELGRGPNTTICGRNPLFLLSEKMQSITAASYCMHIFAALELDYKEENIYMITIVMATIIPAKQKHIRHVFLHSKKALRNS